MQFCDRMLSSVFTRVLLWLSILALPHMLPIDNFDLATYVDDRRPQLANFSEDRDACTRSLNMNRLGSQGDIIIEVLSDLGSAGVAGHAAIVSSNAWQTIESYPKAFSPIRRDGVQRYRNNWQNISGALLYRPRQASPAQFARAARYAEAQVGKPYNWHFWDKMNSDSFYCSQLVWRAWLEAGIDIEEGTFPNAVVAPADLAKSRNTVLVERVR